MSTSKKPKQKRPRLLVRLPYYFLLVGLSAVYYGYVVSLCLNWLILSERKTRLAFILLSAFHVIFGMTLWCLVTAVNRGPGAVGEMLSNSSDSSRNTPSEHDLEGGEQDSLIQEQDFETEPVAQSHHRAPRRRSRRHSSRTNSSTENDEEGERDYLEMRPSSSSDEDSDVEGDFEAMYGPEQGDKVQIVYPGASAKEGSTLMAKANGKARFCRKCNVAKPDRSHHCSTCGYCILKMDHHCPWLGGCVGFKNYRPFILFLFYADLLSAFCAGSALWALIQVLDRDVEFLGLAPVAWGFLVLFGFLFTIMLSGFFPYHLYLATNNRTTIENMERNGRLLSLPARAESMLAAGTTDPATASLPTHPKSNNGQPLLNSQPLQHPRQNKIQTENPFLPPSASATFSSSANQPVVSTAAQILTRQSRRALEKKAGQINIYDLGTSSRNFAQAFGGEWYDWKSWIPIGPSGKGNGYEYPVNRAKLERLRAMNDQLRRSGDAGI